MDLLRLLVLIVVWVFMWRWVVKNRGSWNLLIGNLIGAAGGFIVGMVVFSITLSLFPMEHKVEQTQSGVTAKDAVKAETAAAPVLIPPADPVPAAASDNLPAYVAGKSQNEPSPPESALMPLYASRMEKTMSEKKLEDGLGQNYATLRKMMGNSPSADKSTMAAVMCIPFIQRAMRFPAAAVITPQAKVTSKLFKDQTYTISNTVTGRNMLGDDVVYKSECSIQQLPIDNSGYADWRLLNLTLEKAGS